VDYNDEILENCLDYLNGANVNDIMSCHELSYIGEAVTEYLLED